MTTSLIPVGTAVHVLADTFDGEHAVTGIVAGHVAYTRPVVDDAVVIDQGYAIHLDHGFFGGQDHVPYGCRPYIGTIVAHVDSVTVS